MIKTILNCSFIIFSLCFCMVSHASCYTNQGGASPQAIYATSPSFTVQRDLPVGSTIGSFTTPVGASPMLSCRAGGGIYAQMSLFTSRSAISHVYNTNVPGVGVSISTPAGYFAGVYFESPASFFSNPINQSLNMSSRTVTFVKTGAITSGVVSSGMLARVYGDGDGVTAASINFTGPTITQVACSISTPNLTFPIGDVLVSKFGSTVGTIPAGGQNTQNLGLSCDYYANINVTLSGTQNPDVGTTSVLALTNQGDADVAKGVGVQILYNSTVLSRNSRIVLKRSSGGQEMLPITARYYQTKSSVTTGKANSTATLDLTYQ